MAKKKNTKPKLKIVKNDPVDSDPEDIDMDDINYAADKIIARDDMLDEDDLANAFIRLDVAKKLAFHSNAIKEEFEIVVDVNSEQLIYDAVPVEKLLVYGSNLECKGIVWVVSVQAVNEEYKSPFEILAVTESQEGALNICQGEMSKMLNSYPIERDEFDILIKKEHIKYETGAKLNIKTEFYIKQLHIIYGICSQLCFWRDDSAPGLMDE